MGKKTTRMVLDAALTVLIVASMLVQYTGVMAHEIIGALFFVAIASHLVLSFGWIRGAVKRMGKSKLKGKTRVLFVMAVLLAIDCAVLAASSIAISRTLASVGLASTLMSSAWKMAHAISSYALCVLCTAHLAMHWVMLFSWMRVPYDPGRRAAIGRGVQIVAGVGAVALGVACADALELLPGAREALGSTEIENSDGKESAFQNVSDVSADSVQVDASTTSSEEIAAPQAISDSAATESAASSPAASSSATTEPAASSSAATSSSSAVTGICTLCKKRCPLSAPQCDKPYLAGLIS